MASKNVETLRSVHERWNRRDFAAEVDGRLGQGLFGRPNHQPRLH
jgi:hypothetical protein